MARELNIPIHHNMAQYLIISVRVKKCYNPLRPLSFIDMGHADVILWAPPKLPEAYGLYTNPASISRVFMSVFLPQRARLYRSNRFTHVLAYWRQWELTNTQFNAVKQYLTNINVGCKDGSIRYDAIHFNCLHIAYRCLIVADLNTSYIPIQRIGPVYTITPLSFINYVMPDARYSIMEHDLDHSFDVKSN